jgi:plasmid maintenance system antidote protein VapI
MKKNGMRPVPPGEILNEEFLKPLGDGKRAREADRMPTQPAHGDSEA